MATRNERSREAFHIRFACRKRESFADPSTRACVL